jgi:hypothetical protein
LLAALIGLSVASGASLADEGGVSFWLPGQYASFAAIAPAPGFSLPMQGYYYGGSAGGSTALERGGELGFGLDTGFAGLFLVPTLDAEGHGLRRPAGLLAGVLSWLERGFRRRVGRGGAG